MKSLERNILKFVGISPVQHMLVGNFEGDADTREGWLAEMFSLGEMGHLPTALQPRSRRSDRCTGL